MSSSVSKSTVEADVPRKPITVDFVGEEKSSKDPVTPTVTPDRPITSEEGAATQTRTHQQASALNTSVDDDSLTSNDDSSYFADPNNLPSPKSGGRKYSFSGPLPRPSSRQSDASLSFSEDSDEPPDMQAYPSVARMHSASSLNSSGSEDIPDEQRGHTPLYVPSGRLSPTLGHHTNSFRTDRSPPTILQQLGTYDGIPAPDARTGMMTFSGDSQSPAMGGPPNFASGMASRGVDGARSGQFPKGAMQAPGVSRSAVATMGGTEGGDAGEDDDEGQRNFKVYWQRWIMLLYMSILNLLSDWTCYSVAPIAVLTEEAFGNINPEQLVVVFLGANAVATACEPIILSRLGLRRTVLFGSLLLMIGSIVKSGGMPPIIQADIEKGQGEWRVYLGFFLVGLSQPLYQCTPALLSASWFPERERTMATGVALNANQVGIGFAFIFGTLLVKDSDDIPNYFGLLSIVSTICFLGTLIQFGDAPPTPPSDTAKVMRGTIEARLPSIRTIIDSVRGINASDLPVEPEESKKKKRDPNKPRRSKSRSGAKPSTGGTTGPVATYPAPSPMMPGPVRAEQESDSLDESEDPSLSQAQGGFPMAYPYGMPYPPPPVFQGYDQSQGQYAYGYQGQPPPVHAYPPVFWDPNTQQYQYYPMYPPPPLQPQAYPGQYRSPMSMDPYYAQHILPPPPHMLAYQPPQGILPEPEGIDSGAEPLLMITPHHLDIDIRDDQIILSTRACLARPGFIHALVSFTVSGIVINTLSTYMDYLVRLNGVGREYTGIVGGSFQFVIMLSSLIIGSYTDKTRAYYSVTIGMLVLGAFGLAECGVSLDADRGKDLRRALIVVALLVGPLQPVSTELGVDVVYPLSENTVLVIQQLFSNLLSALFIPCFKALKDVGVSTDGEQGEHPEYTFSFYLLIVIHAAATVFFATFNGRYLRYEHELDKKEAEEQRRALRDEANFPPGSPGNMSGYGSFPGYMQKDDQGDRHPLL